MKWTAPTRPTVSGPPAAGASLNDVAVKHLGAHTDFAPDKSPADQAAARDSALLPRVEEAKRRVAAAKRRLRGTPARGLLVILLASLLVCEVGASVFLMNRAGVEPPADWFMGVLLALTLATAVTLMVLLYRIRRSLGLLVFGGLFVLSLGIGLMRAQEVDTGAAEDAPWLPFVTAVVMGATIVGVPIAMHWIITVLIDKAEDFDELRDAKTEYKELKERFDSGRATVLARVESDLRYDEAMRQFKADMRSTYPELFPPDID